MYIEWSCLAIMDMTVFDDTADVRGPIFIITISLDQEPLMVYVCWVITFP